MPKHVQTGTVYVGIYRKCSAMTADREMRVSVHPHYKDRSE